MKFFGIYRGIVVSNTDDNISDKTLRGKCKVWVAGIMPFEYKKEYKKLPWAEPAYPILGSNASGGGINSVPSVNTHVWVFFEEGEHLSPVYFLESQGGDSWTSDHVKQHTINTERVSVVLDDAPDDGSKNAVLTIDVANTDKEAVEINISGNVNINITGDVTQTIIGDVTETVVGNKTITSTGALTITGNPTILN